MNVSNIVVPGAMLLLPILALLSLASHGGVNKEKFLQKVALSTFAIVILVSAFAVFHYQVETKMSMAVPFALDTSGYFEFSFHLHWIRFAWIFFFSVCLLVLSMLDGKEAFSERSGELKYTLLMGVSAFSSLALFSENIFLTLFFGEVMVFLIHTYVMLGGGEDAALEKDSFFKREVLVFLGLGLVLVLNISGLIFGKTMALVMALLYIVAAIFSRHTFVSWPHVPLSMINIGINFFVITRIFHEEVSAHLWLPITVLFGLISGAFSCLSLLSRPALSAVFWVYLSYASALLLQRFQSGFPQASFWPLFEAVGLLSIMSFFVIVRANGQQEGLTKKITDSALVLILLMLLAGALPGLELAAHEFERQEQIGPLVFMAGVFFVLSAAMGKLLFFPDQDSEKETKRKTLKAFAWPVSLIIIFLQIVSVLFLINRSASDLGTFFSGLNEATLQIHFIVLILSVVAGFGSGAILGLNGGFQIWIDKKNQKMEKIFPITRNIFSHQQYINIFCVPQMFIANLGSISRHWAARVASFLEGFDVLMMSEGIQEGVAGRATALSQVFSRQYSGNIRKYFFVGVMVSLLASILFVLVGL